MSDSEKSNFKVLILGGCGFIGRHIIEALLDSDVASKICAVDKVPPQIAWMNNKHLAMFDDKRVSFKSSNLMIYEKCQSVMSEENWDWVINAAGETKLGQEEAVLKEGILKISTNCSKAAASNNIPIYLELSSGNVASSEKIGLREDDTCQPKGTVAKFKYEAEKIIADTPNLNWIIVRPGLVYGPTDKHGLTSRLMLGAVYHHLGETMKLMWDENLKVNTVHVMDLAKGIIWLCKRGETQQIFHMVDDNNTTQGYIAKLVSEIFDIEHDYVGNMVSNIAKMDMQTLVSEINEKHLSAWAKMCSENKLENTPLNPYIDEQALIHSHLNLDGSKLRNKGFNYSVPRPTKSQLIEIINEFISMKLFPSVSLAK